LSDLGLGPGQKLQEMQMQQISYCCHCGAAAEIGFPGEHGLHWFCRAHAPWQCVGCGPEAGDEDNYPEFEDQQHDHAN
jgi:hypothetical protein